MSIGNQKFDIPRKYQNQIGIWYFCPKFLGIFLVFYRNFVNVLVNIWFNIGILGQNKIGLVFGFCVCHFIGIGLVSVCHFPENDISSVDCLPPSLAGNRSGTEPQRTSWLPLLPGDPRYPRNPSPLPAPRRPGRLTWTMSSQNRPRRQVTGLNAATRQGKSAVTPGYVKAEFYSLR